jgi:hypothetical protein
MPPKVCVPILVGKYPIIFVIQAVCWIAGVVPPVSQPTTLKHLSENNFECKEHHGSEPNVSIPKMLGYLRKRVKVERTYAGPGSGYTISDQNICLPERPVSNQSIMN